MPAPRPGLFPKQPMRGQTVRLPPELQDRVRARAKALGVRPSEVLRAYIEAGDWHDTRREAKEATE